MSASSFVPAGVSAAELLDAWESASLQPAWARPLSLLAAASPEAGEDLVDLAVGERDRRLLALRQALFGASAQAIAPCPACDEPAELDLSVEDLRAVDEAAGRGEHGSVRVAGHEVTFRLPTSGDLAAVATGAAEGAGPESLAAELLARCVVEVHGPNGTGLAAGALPPGAADAVEAAMADADPLADLTLALRCPACGHDWAAPFDIGDFLWREVAAWAERTLQDVDVLARAYGWPEPEVLALSPWRRGRYVELAGR